MKRLLGLLGLTCLVVLTAVYYLGATFSVVLGLLAVILFTVSMFIPKLRKGITVPVTLVTIVFAVSLFGSYTYFYAEPIKDKYHNKEVPITAVQVSEETYSYGYYSYELDVTKVDGKDVSLKMMLRSKHSLYSEPYDIITFNNKINLYKTDKYASKGIFIQAYIFDDSFTVTKPESRPLMYHIMKLRTEFSKALYLEMDYDTASFSSAVLLGDKYAIEPEAKELFRINGISHIAVVSGLHLSVIALICRKLFTKIFCNRILSGSLTILFVLLFTALTGFGVSVIRAAVMLIIFTIGTMVGRKGDSLNSIGAAALLLILMNPYCVGDVGMLLSFAATLGIVLWSSKLSVPVMRKLDKFRIMKLPPVRWLVKIIINTMSCNLCATLWTLPITILVFKGFSLVSLAANLLVVPFMFLVLLGISLVIVIHYIPFLSVLGDTISFLIGAFYDYIIAVCTFLSNLPFAYIHTTKSYFYIWLIASILLAVFASFMHRKTVTVIPVLLSALILFSGSAVYRIIHRDVLTLHIPDTGSGLSVLVESNDSYAVLCASGSKSRSYILGNKIETLCSGKNNVLVSIGGNNSDLFAENLTNEFDYEHILRYDNNADGQHTDTDTEGATLFSERHTLKLWNKAQIELIPWEKSVFEYITIGNTTVLVVPRSADCENLPVEYRKADYVIADGLVDNPQLLEFNSLIASTDNINDDHSLMILRAKAENVYSGADVSVDININQR